MGYGLKKPTKFLSACYYTELIILKVCSIIIVLKNHSKDGIDIVFSCKIWTDTFKLSY